MKRKIFFVFSVLFCVYAFFGTGFLDIDYRGLKRYMKFENLKELFSDDGSGERIEEKYNESMDRKRLRDLKILSELVRDYRFEVGYFPLQDAARVFQKGPVVVFLTRVPKKIKKPKITIFNFPVANFERELERVLARDIELPLETQTESDESGRPLTYIYIASKQNYYISVYTYGEFSFAKKIGENNYKVEIGSKPNVAGKIWRHEELMANPDFQEAIR